MIEILLFATLTSMQIREDQATLTNDLERAASILQERYRTNDSPAELSIDSIERTGMSVVVTGTWAEDVPEDFAIALASVMRRQMCQEDLGNLVRRGATFVMRISDIDGDGFEAVLSECPVK